MNDKSKLPHPPDPEAAHSQAECRINQPARPARPSAEAIRRRHDQIQRWIITFIQKRSLLRAVEELLLDALDEPIAFDRCERALDAYSRAGGDRYTGLDAARIAGLATTWEDDRDN